MFNLSKRPRDMKQFIIYYALGLLESGAVGSMIAGQCDANVWIGASIGVGIFVTAYCFVKALQS